MKCKIVSSEWKQADNGNRYCKLSCVPEGDPWASPFTYVFFVRTEEEETRLANNMPKHIHLAEVIIPTGPFNRVWLTDGTNHAAGELVQRRNKNGELVPAVFQDIKVIIRTMPDGSPARGENAEKLAMQAYERGVADGSIVPLEEGEEEDIFSETESGIDPDPEPPVQPVNQPNQQVGRPQQHTNVRR